MKTPEQQWAEYLAKELPIISELLSPYHITLDKDQPHIQGERFLIQNLTTTSGQKLILLGTDTKNQKAVVIKATNNPNGKAELRHERICRTLLHQMNFSYESFHSPKELHFIETHTYTLYVGEFIEQTSPFLDRPLSEQFSFALRALKAQEQTRATTAGHLRKIKSVFGTRTSSDYMALTEGFIAVQSAHELSREILPTAFQTKEVLAAGRNRIEQYGNFLTHTDFVPHNFRIRDGILYLLDFSSLRFGNKHESWARFLNFMTLYNPDLESLLLSYVKHNRSTEEQESLHLMRLFRLLEIMTYYIGTLKKSSGSLHTLNTERVRYWHEVLKAELTHERVSSDITETYKKTRDQLRSDAEKLRQSGLH